VEKLESHVARRNHIVFHVDVELLIVMDLRIIQVTVVDFIQYLLVLSFVHLLQVLFL
jgi:hypothetical protein